jgi:hypothetical protein
VPASPDKQVQIIELQFLNTLKSNKDAKLHLYYQMFDFIVFIMKYYISFYKTAAFRRHGTKKQDM